MFGNSTIGLLLLLTHILSSISVGICFRFYKSKNKNKNFYNTYKNKSNTKI